MALRPLLVVPPAVPTYLQVQLHVHHKAAAALVRWARAAATATVTAAAAAARPSLQHSHDLPSNGLDGSDVPGYQDVVHDL